MRSSEALAHRLSRLTRGLVLLVCMLLGLIGCTRLFFQPTQQHVFDPARAGIEYRSVDFASRDGVRLHAWLLPAQTEEPRGTVVFAHGNAENISTHIASVWWLPRHGFNVFLFDYRGFGHSEGTPELAGAIADTRAALRAARELPEVDAKRLILFGQSLGGAIALVVAAQDGEAVGLRGVVAESSPASFRRAGREALAGFWLTWPFQWLAPLFISDRWAPLRHIEDLSPIPLLLIAGQTDQIIDPRHSEALFEAAGEPKVIWRVAGAGHIQSLVEPARRAEFVAMLEHWLSAPGSP